MAKKPVPVRPAHMWAVTNNAGDLFTDTISNTRSSAIDKFLIPATAKTWQHYYGRGFRTVKVTVTARAPHEVKS